MKAQLTAGQMAAAAAQPQEQRAIRQTHTLMHTHMYMAIVDSARRRIKLTDDGLKIKQIFIKIRFNQDKAITLRKRNVPRDA